HMFIQHGIHQVSMEKIAAEAELAKGTLYLYFRNRDELLMALVSEEMEVLVAELERVAASKYRADRKILRGVEAFYTFATEHQLFYQVMTQVNVQSMIDGASSEGSIAEVGERFHSLNQRMYAVIASILRQGVDSGIFYLSSPIEHVGLQFVLMLKGTVVILRNNMLPPLWPTLNLRDILLDQAQMFIRALSYDPRRTEHDNEH
ncbi:MAG: TetR/AcrR family transcriptional regulator, partial [Candidatus Kapaibacteriota bacterium]